MINGVSFETVAKAVNRWAKIELEQRKLGVDVNLSAFMQLQNYLSKIIVLRPRKVSCSKSFIFPTKFNSAFEELNFLIVNGKDVNEYLSRKTKEAFFTDGLLDNYGIHHFHFEKTGTLELALAIVTEDEVFFIKTTSHGFKYPYTWVDKSILEVVHKERPDLMPCIKSPFISTESDIMKKEEIKILRDKGYSFMIALDDGATYMPASGGSLWNKNKNKRLSTQHFNRFNYCVRDIQQVINLYITEKIEAHRIIVENIEVFDLVSTDFKTFHKYSIKVTYSKDNFRGEITEIFQRISY